MIYNIERPKTFDEMKGQNVIVNNIRNQSKKREFFSVYILGGQFGAGKTSMARIITLAANCNHIDENGNPCLECENCKDILNDQTPDVIELDGASNTGVDSIRELIGTVSYLPSIKYKVYIIDEVHMLSKGAFNSLLKTLEEPPEHCIFILCTTEMNVIPATVRSRAAKYYFGQISDIVIIEHLNRIALKYDIHADENVFKLITKNSSGSLRNALSLLEQVSKTNKHVNAKDVEKLLGVSDPKYAFELLGYMLKNDTSSCIMSIEKLTEMGKDLFLLVSDMLDICADAVVAACSNINDICNTESYKEQLGKLLSITNQKQVCLLANALIKVRGELRKTPTKTTLVVEVIRITTDVQSLSNNVIERLEYLEKMIEESSARIQVNNSILINEVSEEKETLELSEQVMFSSESKDKSNKTNSKNASVLDNSAYSKIEEKEIADVENVRSVHQTIVIDESNNETKGEDEIIDPGDNINENQEDVEDIKEEIKIDTNSNYDVFDLMDLFGHVKNTKETGNKLDQKIQDKQDEKSEILITNEPSDLSSQSIDGIELDCEDNNELNNVYDTRDISNNIIIEGVSTQTNSAGFQEDALEQTQSNLVKYHMQQIEALYQDLPMLESAIDLGCEIEVIEEKVLFITKFKPIFDIVNTIIDNYNLDISIELRK